MTAFAAILDALFVDPNIGREAVYTSDGGAPVLVRVVSRHASASPATGSSKRSAQEHADIMDAALAD